MKSSPHVFGNTNILSSYLEFDILVKKHDTTKDLILYFNSIEDFSNKVSSALIIVVISRISSHLDNVGIDLMKTQGVRSIMIKSSIISLIFVDRYNLKLLYM